MKQQPSNEKLSETADKWLKGTITTKELELLDEWYNTDVEQELSWLYTDESESQLNARLFAKIKSKRHQTKGKGQKWWLAAAALIALTTGISTYLYLKAIHSIEQDISYNTDIDPGGNKAFLTLANGKKISLTDAKNGRLAEQSGIKISKTADGRLTYTITNSTTAKAVKNAFNTIETPKGGQWQVSLPDGTKVWLNAASSLKYPASFAAAPVRRVELRGEAYFEVSKDKLHPFMVKTHKQDVQVLGTHFNINSYADEPVTKTTLLEGSVSISPLPLKGDAILKPEILKPGQQAVNNGSVIQLNQVDTELAVAWKNNKFIFENDNIHYIMRMIERWYNVEIIYEGDVPTDKFGGAVSRFDQISEVLKSLQLTGKVHFEIEGRRITVRK